MAKENQTQNASEETVSVAPEAVAPAQGTTTIVKKAVQHSVSLLY